ncbi:MAG TPA: STAS/SEC14 domain-containing protein [Salinibacter sp.]|nr:STAS/SEC14 domain-containing protein [Salinibacter sp.]
MIEILDVPDTNIVGFHFSDTLTEEDYETLVTHLRDKLKAHTTTRVLFEIEDVDGWEPEEKWNDFTFDMRHVQDLDKVAVIGDDPWEPLVDKIELLFPMSLIQEYEDADREEGLSWLRGEMDVPGIGPGSVPDPDAGAQDEDE